MKGEIQTVRPLAAWFVRASGYSESSRIAPLSSLLVNIIRKET